MSALTTVHWAANAFTQNATNDERGPVNVAAAPHDVDRRSHTI
jgi:hypothetical protein